MKAVEVAGQIDKHGRLVINHLPLSPESSGEVKVIVLYPDETESNEDPYDTPLEEVEASLRQALKEVKAGERISLSELWEEFEKD
jgi:hypothetical protein